MQREGWKAAHSKRASPHADLPPAAFFKNSSTSASLDRPPLSFSLFHSTCGASLTASERADEPSSPPDFLAAADGCSGRGLRAGRPPLEDEKEEEEEDASSALGMSVERKRNSAEDAQTNTDVE